MRGRWVRWGWAGGVLRTSSVAVKGEAMRHHDVSWNVVAQLLGTSFATLKAFKGHIRKCWFIYT